MKARSIQIVNHIPEDNFLFSVLGVNNESFYEAIMEHFFEINYYYEAMQNCIIFNFEEITNWNSFKGINAIYLAQSYLDLTLSFSKAEFLLNHFLQHGFHLLVPIDQNYIQAYNSQGQHVSHTLYIKGTAKNNDAFYCQDFFTGCYKTRLVPKRELLNAICNYRDTYNEQWDGQETGLVAIKKKERYIYKFRPRFFLNRFRNMICFEYDNSTQSYGLGLFDAIMETHTNNVDYWTPCSTRRFYQFIADNLELMKHRLMYLNRINRSFDIDELWNKSEKIQAFCIRQRNKLLKYEMLHNNELTVSKGDDVKKCMIEPLGVLKKEFCGLIQEILCKSDLVCFCGISDE